MDVPMELLPPGGSVLWFQMDPRKNGFLAVELWNQNVNNDIDLQMLETFLKILQTSLNMRASPWDWKSIKVSF